MIVVTAPTGNIGRHVVERLMAAGAPCRLIVRDAGKLPAAVRDGAEVVEGSHGDAAVVDRAFAGAEAVFWLVPPNPMVTLEQAYVEFSRPAAAAIRRHGVGHVVTVTALGRGTPWADRAGLVTASLRMDDLMMATGAAFRGLAMPSFMDNMLRQVEPIRTQGLFFGPADPDRKAPATATRDMGAAAAALLERRDWAGQEEAPLLGPEDLSQNDMAAILSDVLGREIRYRQITMDEQRAQLLGRGVSDAFADGYVEMMRAKNEGLDNGARRTPATASPTGFRQWCETVLKPAVAA